MVGENSDFVETLKLINDLNVVDKKKLNLLIVVTHACFFPLTSFSKDAKEKSEEIRDLLVSVLGEHTKTTKVVFVDNKPEKYNLKQIKSSEFYELPDGTRSHYALIQEMTHTFLVNGDILGGLACGSYFADKNAEKPKATRISQNNDTNVDPEASDSISIEADADSNEMHRVLLNILPELPLKFLGHGFCPLNEIEKSNIVLEKAESRKLEFFNSNFTHSAIIDKLVEENEEIIFVRLSQRTPEEHKQERLKRYGLENETSFFNTIMNKFLHNVFDIWSPPQKANVYHLVYLHEWRIRSVEIDHQTANISDELITRLKQLPKNFNRETRQIFRDFFDDWGSHFVQKSYLGGSIRLVLPESYTSNDLQLQSELENHILTLGKRIDMEPFRNSSDSIAYSKIFVIFNGGIPPAIAYLSELTPEVFQAWIYTLGTHPAELQDYLTLKSFELLTEEPLKESLHKATLSYVHEHHAALSLTREAIGNAINTLMLTDSVTSRFVGVDPIAVFETLVHDYKAVEIGAVMGVSFVIGTVYVAAPALGAIAVNVLVQLQ